MINENVSDKDTISEELLKQQENDDKEESGH